MLLVPCPHCGPRNSSDLAYQGESHPRPNPNEVDPERWRAHLYLEDNPAGWLRETWYCRSGCRRFFVLERNTATNEFRNPPLPGNKSAGSKTPGQETPGQQNPGRESPGQESQGTA